MPEESPTTRETPSRAPLTSSHGSAPNGGARAALTTLRNSWEIARLDLLRGYRWVRTQDFWLAFMVVVGIISAFLLLETYEAARSVGSAIVTGAATPGWLLTATGVLWLFLTLLLTGDGVGSNSDLEHDGQYLTLLPAVDVVGGMLIAAAGKFSVYTIGLALAAGAGLAAGTGSPLPLIGMLTAAIVVVVTAAAIGYPIGFALKGFIRRSRNLGRVSTVIVVALAVAYVTLSVTGELLTVVETVEPIVQSPPLAWFGHLALLTTPGATVDVTGALVLLVLTPLIVVAGTKLSVRAARYAWLADAAHATDGDEADLPTAPDHRTDAFFGVLTRALPTLGIASTTLRRAVRSPLQFVFVAPPMVAGITFVEGAVTSGTVPWYVPWFVVWYGAWATGAVIPLNPLGNQGATLPALLTAPARGRHLVHGHVVAAAAIGAPLTAVLAIGAGYLAGSSGTLLVALGVSSVAAVVASAVIATGIGSVFPRFDAVSFDGSRQAVPPSKRAYALFSIALSTIVLAAVFVSDETARSIGALVLSQWLPWGIDVGVGTVMTISSVVLAGGLLAVPTAYRTAVRRLDTFHVE